MDYKNAKGWLRPEEREALVELAASIESDNAIIVNIGVEYGASLACLRTGNPKAEIYGIDIDISKAVDDYGCKLIEENSSFFFYSFPGGETVDLLFIDGDHTYEGVQSDIMWINYICLGGYIIFHDCYDYDDPSLEVHGVCPGVNYAVNEWKLEMLGRYAPYMGSAPAPKIPFKELEPIGTMRIFRRVQ